MDEDVRRPALLNSASFGEPSARTRDAMRAHLKLEDEFGAIAAREQYDHDAIRSSAARLIGAAPAGIAFPASTSEGWAKAVLSLPMRGRKALITPWEWGPHGILLERLGLKLEIMPVIGDTDADRQPRLDLDRIAEMIDTETALVSAPMISSATGIRVDVEALGALARPDGCWFVVDGAQTLGHMPVDVAAIRCDVFAATARKWLRGPAGSAVLAISDAALEAMGPNLMPSLGGMVWEDGRLQDVEPANRFESFDRADAVRVGLGAAVDDALEADLSKTSVTLLQQAREIAARLDQLDGCCIFPSDSAIVAFTWSDPDRDRAVWHALADAHLLISQPGPHYEPWSDLQSPVLRISAAADARATDIDRFFRVVEAAL